MNILEEKQVNERLCRAVSVIPANHVEKLWNVPVEKVDSSAWFLDGTMKKPGNTARFFRLAGLAAACFAIILLGWFQVFRLTDATVYLDVNPSVELDVNRLGRIVSTEAENEDGQIILDDMDLRGTEVDVAMNALLGSMVKHGYLSQAQNTLLISVNGKNGSRTAALRSRLSADAGHTLETLLGNGVVLGQTVERDDEAEDIAAHYGITPGKAVLIQRIVTDRPSWNVHELASMSMTALIRYVEAAGIDLSQYLGENGEIIGDTHSLLDEDDPDDDDRDDNDDLDDVDNDPDENDDFVEDDDRDEDDDFDEGDDRGEDDDFDEGDDRGEDDDLDDVDNDRDEDGDSGEDDDRGEDDDLDDVDNDPDENDDFVEDDDRDENDDLDDVDNDPDENDDFVEDDDRDENDDLDDVDNDPDENDDFDEGDGRGEDDDLDDVDNDPDENDDFDEDDDRDDD